MWRLLPDMPSDNFMYIVSSMMNPLPLCAANPVFE